MVIKCAGELKLGKYMRRDATYCFVSGPSYESRAECRFLRGVGGDSVGMSTIPEIIAAKHVGMKIVCLSMITNKVVVEKSKDAVHATHEEVLGAVKAAGTRVESLVKGLIDKKVIGKYLEALPTPAPYKGSSAASKGPSAGYFKDVHVPTIVMAGLVTLGILFARDHLKR
jgi:hypothetical protein